MSAPTARYPQGPQGLPPRTSPLKQAMSYLFYGGGHFLLDFPRLPSCLRSIVKSSGEKLAPFNHLIARDSHEMEYNLLI
jgi:hypothetical protein